MSAKITLFCNAGMSTSLLVKRMQDQAKLDGKDYDINAYGLTNAIDKAPEADVILVGPQVRHALEQIQGYAPNVPIESIDMRTYGMMDAKGCLKQAEKLLAQK